MKPKDIVGLFKETLKEWQEDKAARLAAALSYYTAFSIAPLLIIVIAIAALVLGQDAAQGEIVKQLKGLIGLQGAEAIQEMIKNSQKPTEGIIATVISFIILIFGATGVFAELQDSLNTIWEVAPKPGQGVKAVVKTRFRSFAMILGIGFILLVSLVLSSVLVGVSNYFGNYLPDVVLIARIANLVISFGVITVLFAMIYRVLPDVEIAWGDVWLGAAITSLLFSIGKWGIGLYLGNSSVGSTYGAAGSFVVFLLWVNYSAQILFFGAEFTQVYANKYGSQIRPAKNAVPLTEDARANLGIPHSDELESAAEQDDSARSRTSTAVRERRNHKKSVNPILIGLSTVVGISKQLSQIVKPKKNNRRNRR
ncbi:ribonuclease BN [Crinalium epipsammum PCC 9333]|uniref:Ribonuclease BN n=1 Tax=Crinalium epipsammum PCC 9333 TaxID=1173022 RepID=K9W1M4_9CYAN|nr:YihY/virulence factor BrkB family protein [Crinalium epipsammum]AFZ14273.1 ribonuclease BN [Crinalium epipsammum PCC 9333]